MKAYKITLPEVEFVNGTEEVEREDGTRTIVAAKINAARQLYLLVAMPEPGQSTGIAQMRTLTPLLDELETLAENGRRTLTVGKEDYERLQHALAKDVWLGYNKSAIALEDAVLNAEEVEIGGVEGNRAERRRRSKAQMAAAP